jgi:hypothetical protein
MRELQNLIERTAIISVARVLKLEIEELHLWVESKEEIRTHTQPWSIINCGDGNPFRRSVWIPPDKRASV